MTSSGNNNTRLFMGAVELKAIARKVKQLAEEIESHTLDGAPAVIVHSYRALVRAVGFYKYSAGTHVVLRGQPQCYRTMRATHHRLKSPPSDRKVDAFLDRFRRTLDVDTEPRQRLSTEPLLQHYGIRTRWLDVVDSLPHALFFATNELCDGSTAPTKSYRPSLRKYGFIYVIDVGHPRTFRQDRKPVTGYWCTSAGCLLADLRALKPSSALRPHAQHGLLVRVPSANPELWPMLVARIAVPASEARHWISALALERESLFPPPIWDNIYGSLMSPTMNDFLESEHHRGNNWGEIQRFDFAV